MPEFTFTISDATLQRLQNVVARYNENTGQNLTLKQWAIRHLKEIAVSQDFGAEVERIKKEREEAERAAQKARFEEMLAELGDE